MSQTADPLFQLLVRRSRGETRARALIDEVSLQLGAGSSSHERVVIAVALVRAGEPPESVGTLMSWREFEDFCAGILEASGYSVARNIVITKPRRQLDLFAESAGLALSVDCKHWAKGFSPSELARIATDQVERTILYKAKRSVRIPVLPVILTLVDAPARVVSGVPVVPMFALRDFLASVNRFEPGLGMV
ncbi:MAG: restriction endonuclease [Nitrososphaerota archaeon]|nr:restriction endonuclease [Nitrososphaerota archaeon]